MFSRVRTLLLVIVLGVAFTFILWRVLQSNAGSPPNLLFLDEGDVYLAEEKIRILCYRTDTPGAPFADFMVETDMMGVPKTPIPKDCNYVAALQELHEQPSGKLAHGPAYWVYNTSWLTGTTNLIDATGSGDTVVIITSTNHLVLFNVVASLAWQPPPGSSYVTELRQGIGKASAYLYDLTDGQMAFGPLSIFTNGRNWEGADLRILAANDYRPSAFVGGFVHDTTAITTSGRFSRTLYAPGAIYFGRYWDGYDAFDANAGNWEETDASRTLAHEWLHYATFLYDEYQDSLGDKTFCTDSGNRISTDDSASAMDYHYTTSELWHPIAHVPDLCEETWQYQVHGLSDWDTLAKWYDYQGINNVPGIELEGLRVPMSAPTPVSEIGLVKDLFGRSPGHRRYLPLLFRSGPTPVPPSNTIINAALEDTILAGNHLLSYVYLVEEDASGSPTNIVHHGRIISTSSSATQFLGLVTLLGVPNDAGFRIFVDRYRTEESPLPGRRYAYSADQVPTSSATLDIERDNWKASLDNVYGLEGTQLTTMTVYLTSTTSLTPAPTAQLCLPDAGVGCHPNWKQTMTKIEDSDPETWSASFTPLPGMDEMPLYSLVHIDAPGAGELIRWVQVAGGVGPAHQDVDAPLRDGPLMVDATEPIAPASSSSPAVARVAGSGADDPNQVIFMPAAHHPALEASLGEVFVPSESVTVTVQGLISAYDIDIILDSFGSLPGDHVLRTPVILTLFYSQKVLDHLGIPETFLVILHYSRSSTSPGWSVVSIPLAPMQNEDLDWISAMITEEDGIYALGWLAPGSVPEPTGTPTPPPPTHTIPLATPTAP